MDHSNALPSICKIKSKLFHLISFLKSLTPSSSGLLFRPHPMLLFTLPNVLQPQPQSIATVLTSLCLTTLSYELWLVNFFLLFNCFRFVFINRYKEKAAWSVAVYQEPWMKLICSSEEIISRILPANEVTMMKLLCPPSIVCLLHKINRQLY